ncbi:MULTISPECIES: FAD-binding oxidoreductase [unclassified Saccharothrix]|uniref:FAD-binding oxidoreductase n=1 Tax=unclassified Saccharothrix TaxID=2593673 RepID=UPI00307D1948
MLVDGDRKKIDQGPVTAHDQQYLDLVTGMNQRWKGAPETVWVVGSAKQVEAVVQDAVNRGKRLTVRSGGHCFEDFVYNSDVQVVIDVSELNAIYYDPAHNAIAVESGATVLEVYETLYKKWGVTVPAGFCHSVGVGGLVSGGGWGLLVRRDGLVVDHLYGVEVVVVDDSGKARTVVATRDEHDPNRELWWAHTGGGGGSFGVITRYLFRTPGAYGRDPRELLPRPPAEVYLSAVAWPWAEVDRDEFFRLVHNYGAWHVANRAPDNPNRAISSLLGLNHVSNGFLGLVTQIDANLPDADALLDDYLAFIGDGIRVAPGPLTTPMGEINAMPQFATRTRMPWLQATRFLGATNVAINDPTMRAEFKSAYMVGEYPEAHLAALHKHLTRTDIVNPNVSVGVTPYGGQAGAVAPSDTAAVHRGAAFKMLWSAYWNNPAEDEKYVAWARESYQETYQDTGGVPVPNDVTDGCYVNYADIDLDDPALNTSGVSSQVLYHKENYPRLQQVKLRYDPTDFFRHGQSVRLP